MSDALLEYLSFLIFESAWQQPTSIPCPSCGHQYLNEDVETHLLHCPACIGVFQVEDFDEGRSPSDQ